MFVFGVVADLAFFGEEGDGFWGKGAFDGLAHDEGFEGVESAAEVAIG